MSVCGCHCGGMSHHIDARDLPFHTLDSDRDENVIERDPDRSKIGFVVAHTDVVKAVAVDEGHLSDVLTIPKFVEFPGRPNRAPEAGKAASQHEDLLDAHDTTPAKKSITFKAKRTTPASAASRSEDPSQADC